MGSSSGFIGSVERKNPSTSARSRFGRAEMASVISYQQSEALSRGLSDGAISPLAGANEGDAPYPTVGAGSSKKLS
jgi:hypothetical protein